MSRGIQRERQVRDVLLADGWWVCRAAGSLGDADLVAMKSGERPQLIEVKSTVTPWSHFGPKDRAELLMAGRLADADVVLAYWPKRDKLRWIFPEEWPGSG